MKLLILASLIAATYYGYVETGPRQTGYIGIEWDGRKVVKVWKGGSAEAEGLHKGDIVKFINDKDIDGPVFTKVNLTIKRGKQILVFILERVPHEQIDWHTEVKDSP